MPRRDIQPALGYLESALEATCAALISLEAASAANCDVGHNVSVVEDQIRQAITSLREAMAELRALHDVETSALAFGFVLDADPAWGRARRRARRRQFTPRRTA
jgi:hypothetical protein